MKNISYNFLKKRLIYGMQKGCGIPDFVSDLQKRLKARPFLNVRPLNFQENLIYCELEEPFAIIRNQMFGIYN